MADGRITEEEEPVVIENLQQRLQELLKDDDDLDVEGSPSVGSRPRPGAITPLGVRVDRGQGLLSSASANATLTEMDSTLSSLKQWQQRRERDMAELMARHTKAMEEAYSYTHHTEEADSAAAAAAASPSAASSASTAAAEEEQQLQPIPLQRESIRSLSARNRLANGGSPAPALQASVSSSSRPGSGAGRGQLGGPPADGMGAEVQPSTSRPASATVGSGGGGAVGNRSRPASAFLRSSVVGLSHAEVSALTQADGGLGSLRSSITALRPGGAAAGAAPGAGPQGSLEGSISGTGHGGAGHGTGVTASGAVGVGADVSAVLRKGDQMLAELEAELKALDEDASSNSVTSWYADVEQTLAKLDVLQTGYQVMAKKGP